MRVLLSSLIEFKYIVALTNETQTTLPFSKIFKFNAVMYLNLIRKPNVPNIKNYT